MAPITGAAATIGEEQLNWAKLSVDTYNQERGTTLIIVTHDPVIAGQTQRIIRLSDGLVESENWKPNGGSQ